MLRFLLRQFRGYRLAFVLSICMALLQVAADVLGAFPLKFILDRVIDYRDPGWPWSLPLDQVARLNLTSASPPGGPHPVLTVIAFAAAMVVALGLLDAGASYVQLYTARLAGYGVTARLRTTAFRHLLRLSLHWHGLRRTGDLVQRLTGNVVDIEKMIVDGLVDLAVGIFTLLGMVGVMAAFNWQFTLLSVVVVPTLFLIVLSYTRRIKAATKQAARAAGQLADVATDDLRAITEVKAFTLEEREDAHFETCVNRYRASGLRAGRLEAEFRPLVAFVLAVSTFAMLSVGSYVATGHQFRLWLIAIPAGALSIGTLTVFLTYVKQLYQPMRDLSKLVTIATSAAAGTERLQELLDQPPEATDPRRVPPLRARVRGGIEYAGVVFGYMPDRPVIRGVDLCIRPGERIALVGLSGSGKTTLVKLIPRFYLPWRGEVRIDGVDCQQLPLRLLRDSVSLVLQESVLFEGTIRDNIALGRAHATESEIVEAARRAQIHETIVRLPEGYDAHVSEQGRNFSAGQRQRLAIARAFLRDSPILILDEPTASLDVEAEAEVMRAVSQLVRGRTVITISHRLATLGHVDRIVVLADGAIAEQGDFRTLCEQGGAFARLFDEQRRYAPDVAATSMKSS